jgi:endoglucanase
LSRLSLSLSLSVLLTSVAGLTTTGCSTLFPGSSTSAGTSNTTPTGCTASTKNVAHVAPGGYYVNGNTICTTDGRKHLFHGIDRPSLEWGSGEHLSLPDFQLMATWNANTVRISLNQDFWLPGSQEYIPNYASTVDHAVHWAEEAGMDVILDLHWSDQGVLGSCNKATNKSQNCQQVMADANSITFWSQVASAYSGDGRVLFELYNEPHDVSWSVWKSGGMAGGFMVAGMQQLYDAVRAAGADNLVLIGGLVWASDLSGVPANRISGYNILYSTHPYATNISPSGFVNAWGFLTKTDPVIATEFGDGSSCAATYSSEVISYADQHNASWTAWGWYVKTCSFPSLITDWNGTPSMTGAVVKAALMSYGDPSADGKRDAGAEGAVDAGDGGSAAGDGGLAPDGGTTSGDGAASSGDGSSHSDGSIGG